MACTVVCRVCCGLYDIPENRNHFPCAYCGTENGRPQVTEESFDKLQRATRLRLEGHRDEALRCYELVLTEYEDEHEALWGKLLCQYGVEFVTDRKTQVRHATVHVPHTRPMQLHSDFRRACELAPEELRVQYEAEAAYVDEALAEINRRKDSGEPYDVFICHKSTPLDGAGYTEDYNRGVQLTRRLEKAGYRVFFAPFADLQPGASYEAGIYYALWTAKVMLLISSDVTFLNSPWVKSEWSRFLEMLDDGAEKYLVPLMYGGLAEIRMPREIRLRGLQSIRMEDVDATERLMGAMERYTGRGKAEPPKLEPRKPAPSKPELSKPEPQQPDLRKPEPRKTEPRKSASSKPESQKPEPPKPKPRKSEQPKPKTPKPERVKLAPAKGEYAPERDFRTWKEKGELCIEEYIGEGGDVNIPPMIGGQRVKTIGNEAFKNCSSLTSVNIPEGVKSIGGYVFAGCSSLTSVSIPASVLEVNHGVFNGCKSLNVLTVASDNQVYYAQENVLFSYKGELVSYPAGITAKTYNIPEGVTIIGFGAFGGCDNLTSVSISEGVTIIGNLAFWGCSSLTSVSIPEGVIGIGLYAFSGCSSLTSVSIPASVEFVTYGAFNGCKSLHALTVAPDNQMYYAHENVLFSYDGALVSYPARITKKTYNIPQGVTRIVVGAFAGCSSLTSVSIPEGVTSIEEEAFWGCSSLTSVNIPEGVTCIARGTFDGCSSLTSVSIPASVVEVYPGVFKGCNSLNTLAVASDNQVYYAHENVLFSYNRELVCYPAGIATKTYDILQGVTSIGGWAFEGCNNLTSVNIPESVKSIGKEAFANCSSLTSVNIPDGVESIGEDAFANCSSLTNVTIARGVICFEKRITDVFPNLRCVYIPEGVTSIGENAFANCSSLTSVSIPEGVTSIGENAFANCSSLTSVNIPKSVKSIGNRAFRGCPKLKLPLFVKLRFGSSKILG